MLETGEYVRTKKYGNIGKLLKITSTKIYLDSIGYPIDKDEMAKHSKNITDLIKVGDIVEIYDVLNEDVIYIWDEEMLKAVKTDVSNGIGIRRILTKEQYEANCYKVKEE